MGKRKGKKRKNKLARPPKKKAPPAELHWENPDYDPGLDPLLEDITVEPGPWDAPSVPWLTPESERPFGTVDDSMYASTRYQKFRDTAVAIRESLPDSLKSYGLADVPDPKLRQWLTRYCIKKEKDGLPDWQQLILEKTGFNWNRERKPAESRVKDVKARVVKKKAPKKKVPKKKASKKPSRYAVAWDQAHEGLCAACAAATPSASMVALLQCDDTHFNWLKKQILAARADTLKPERRKRLQALPFDFETTVTDPGFVVWRKSFKAYSSGTMKRPDIWAAKQTEQKKEGKLPAWRIEALDAIDFDWDQVSRAAPQEAMEARWFQKLERYLELEAKHGKPLRLSLPDLKPIRSWVSRMRERYHKGQLSRELAEAFEKKGFEFSPKDLRREEQNRIWQGYFKRLEAFKARFGHVRVPSSYAEDPDLGTWLAHQRERWKLGKLDQKKVAKFKAIGVEITYDENPMAGRTHLSVWLKRYRTLCAYLEAEFDGRLPEVGRIPEKDRKWLKRQSKKMRDNELEPWQIEKLDAIGFQPGELPELPPPVDWNDRIERLRHFVREHGHARVSRGYSDNLLYAFVQRVRRQKRDGQLSSEQERELKATGFSFNPKAEVTPAWMRQYETLQAFHQENGHSAVPRNYKPNPGLAEFVAQQKQRGRKGLLLAEHIRLLDALDFPWSHGPPTPK